MKAFKKMSVINPRKFFMSHIDARSLVRKTLCKVVMKIFCVRL